jgi:hypothetical protein
MRRLPLSLIALSLIVGGTLIVTTGCGSNSPTISNDSSPSAAEESSKAGDTHAHPAEGPHHGTLVELGDDEYHIEVHHDATSVTAYVLDRGATNSVPIDARELTINVVHDGAPEQFRLAAIPDQGDPDGKSSRFALDDAELAAHLDQDAALPKINVTINGIPYRGEIKHNHDHSGHDHAH